MRKNIVTYSAQVTNIIVGLVGIVLILIAILIGYEKVLGVVLLSIGTSIFATSIVSYLNSRYLIQQSNRAQMVERWGLDKIYEARSEINPETHKLLRKTQNLEICAMGLKGFRDAQEKVVEKRVSEGMYFKILTIDPSSQFLSTIDKTEKASEGYTKDTILSLIQWVKKLQKMQIYDNQVEIKVYDHYPYDFYFCMDGVTFTGPYQTKSSQQTITYKFAPHSLGARKYKDYFDSLWEKY